MNLLQRIAEWGYGKYTENRHKIVDLPNGQFVYIEYTFDKLGARISYHSGFKDDSSTAVFEPRKDPINPYITPDDPRQELLKQSASESSKNLDRATSPGQ